MTNKADNQLPLRDQIAQLEELVAWFDSEDIDLEEAIEKFGAGGQLAESIKARLSDIDNKITVLRESFDDK